MKASFALLVIAAAGCSRLPGGLASPVATVGLLPKPIRLENEASHEYNGKLEGLDFEWDLGGREYKKIECAGVSSVSGVEAEGPLVSALKVSFTTGKDGAILMKTSLDQKNGNQHTSSSTENPVRIVGGLSGITRTPDARLGRDPKSVTLLQWKSADGSGPPALKIEFR